MSDPLADPTRTQTSPEPPEAAPATVTGSTASQPQVPLGQDAGDTPQFAPPTQPGDQGRLGRYRVVKRLGVGGMGAVYLGEDGVLRRKVALKVMLPRFAANPQAKVRFLREARTAAQVRSEHVVAILDVDEVGGTPFIAMEFLQGIPLDRYLSGNPGLNPAQVIRFGMEVARGLAAAHEKGLIHRDIKPANLFLEAPHGRVKILDFGLAKEAEPGDDGIVTRAGQIVGTPAYMSPEQARGEEHVDHRSDLFSLGVVLYKLCTGRQPFHGPNPMAIAMAIGMDEPMPVRERNPAVPEALAALIHRLMAKKPADRPQTATEVHAALVAIEDADAVPVGDPLDGEEDYVPIAVVVPEGEAWPVGAEVPEAAAEPSSPTGAKPPAARGNPRRLVAFAVVAAVLAVGLLAAVWNRMNRKPEVAVGPPPVPAPGPRPKLPAEPNQAAARWAIAQGGGVQLVGSDEWVTSAGDLPAPPFRVRAIATPETYAVTDSDLDLLRNLPDLREIVFEGGTITDAGVEKLSRFPAAGNYTAVVLAGKGLTDASVPHFARFSALRFAGLSGARLTAAGLTALNEQRPELTALALNGVALTATDFAALTGFKNLRAVGLSVPAATPDALRTLAELPAGLEALELRDGVCGDATLEAVARLPRLASLTLTTAEAADDGLAKLAGHNTLKRLRLVGFTEERLAAIREKLPGCSVRGGPGPALGHSLRPRADRPRVAVEELRESGAILVVRLADGSNRRVMPTEPLPTEGFVVNGVEFRDVTHPAAYGATVAVPLSELPNLGGVYDANRSFVFREEDVARLAAGPVRESLGGLSVRTVLSGRAVDSLKEFPRLSAVYFHAQAAGDAEAARLAEWTGLRDLQTDGLGVSGTLTAKGLAAVGKMPLTNLTLLRAKLTPADFGVLAAGLGDIAVLNLSDTRNAGELLPVVAANFPKLTTLWLNDTPLTDTELLTLKGHKTLKSLQLKKTKVTREGIDRFRAATPLCKVESDFDGKLSRLPPLDPDWVAAVAKMTPQEQVKAVAEELVRRNPGFDGKVTPGITAKGVEFLAVPADFVADLTPVRALPALNRLSCNTPGKIGAVTDLTPLEGLPLQALDLYTNRGLADLGPLKGMPLKSLGIPQTAVEDLTPLADCPLEYLDVAGCRSLKSLAPLAGKPITTLRAHHTGVTDVSPLAGMPLKSVLLDGGPVLDLSPLAKCPQLETLAIEGTGILNLSVAHNVDALRTLPNLKTVANIPAAEFWPAWDRRKDATKLPGPRRTIPAHDGVARWVAFDGDGKRLVTAGPDGKVHLWDAATGDNLRTFVVPKATGQAAEFVPGTDLVAASYYDGLRFWDVKTGNQDGERIVPADKFYCLAVSRDGKTVAVNPNSGRPVPRYSVATRAALPGVAGHTGGLNDSAFSSDGKFLATGSVSPDSSVRVWDLDTAAELARHTRPGWDANTGVRFSRDDRLVFFTSFTGTAALWDWRTNKLELVVRYFPVGAAAFGPGEKFLVLGGYDGVVSVLDAATGAVVAESYGVSRVWRVALSPDEKTVATAHADGTIRLWDWDALAGKKP